MSRPAAPALSRRWKIALGVLVLVGAFVWAFDWNWLRPLIRHYVLAKSGRLVEFDDLKVSFGPSLTPTFQLRGLKIQNAPWAARPQPLVQAGYVAATISWHGLLAHPKIVDRVVLEDAQVDMERRADGVRNWRITRPDDVGPPRVKVIALDARRSRMHLIHRGIDLEMDAASLPLGESRWIARHDDLPLTKRLTFSGTSKGRAFDGDMAVSDRLTFGVTPEVFALQGKARFGGYGIVADGVTSSLQSLGNVDIDATVSSLPDGDPWPLPERFAALRPLTFSGHIAKNDAQWDGSDLRARVGRGTSVRGTVHYTGRPHDDQRHSLSAILTDALVDLDDVGALRSKPASAKGSAGEGAFSTRALPFDRLRELDADVDLRGARFTHAGRSALQSLRGRAQLKDGKLNATGLDLGIADGHVTGSMRLDATQATGAVALDLQAHALRLDRLAGQAASDAALSGRLVAQAALQSRGDSPRALAAAATGTLTSSLEQGASVSKRLDAKLSLDGGAWFRSLFDKSGTVPVECATVSLVLAQGHLRTRQFIFETAHTAFDGRGDVDLLAQTLALTLTPHRKEQALIALDKAIHASGAWHEPKISLTAPLAGPAPRCPFPRQSS